MTMLSYLRQGHRERPGQSQLSRFAGGYDRREVSCRHAPVVNEKLTYGEVDWHEDKCCCSSADTEEIERRLEEVQELGGFESSY